VHPYAENLDESGWKKMRRALWTTSERLDSIHNALLPVTFQD
jgi:hypothetical protein